MVAISAIKSTMIGNKAANINIKINGYPSQAAQLRQSCVNSYWRSQWEALGTSHF